MNDIEIQMVNVVAQTYRMYGLDELSASILSYLFLEPGELTMEELAKLTGYSLASICLKMKLLEDIWGVHRKKRTGSRKIYFSLNKDYLDGLEEILKKSFEKESLLVRQKMPGLLKEYEEQELTASQKQRLLIAQRYCKQVEDVKEIMELIYEEIGRLRSEKWDDKYVD